MGKRKLNYDLAKWCSTENALYMAINAEKPLFFKGFSDFDDGWKWDLGENKAEFLDLWDKFEIMLKNGGFLSISWCVFKMGGW